METWTQECAKRIELQHARVDQFAKVHGVKVYTDATVHPDRVGARYSVVVMDTDGHFTRCNGNG